MKKAVLFLVFITTLVPLFAEISVEISPIVLNEGLAQIEAMVNMQTADATDEITDFLSAYTEKPLLFQAMSESGTLGAASLPFYNIQQESYVFTIGTTASLSLQTYDFEALGEQIDSFDIEDDIYAGAAFQGLSASFGFPGDLISDALAFSAGAGYMLFTYGDISFSSFNIHASASYAFFNKVGNSGTSFKWPGIKLHTGLTYAYNSVYTVYAVETISQTFQLDPDGSGPLVPFYVTISLEPDPIIRYSDMKFTIPLAVSSGIEIFDILQINAGAGAALSFGTNSLEVSVDEEITVEGFLSDLIATSPRLIISGSQDGFAAAIVTPLLFCSLTLSIGNFYFNIPFSWNYGDSISAGFSLGAGF